MTNRWTVLKPLIGVFAMSFLIFTVFALAANPSKAFIMTTLSNIVAVFLFVAIGMLAGLITVALVRGI